MTESVGWAALDIIPRLDRRFDSRLSAALGPGLDRSSTLAGRRAGSAFTRSFSSIVGVGLGAAAVKLVKDSVTLEASYSKTFRQIGVAGDVPAKRLEELDALAINLGTNTIFSANDAASAMLALVKNGLRPATIEAGALKEALTLATAGDLPLDEAAQTMSNTLNAFSLKGKDAASVAAALAGAANASSADVSDLAQALQQTSAVANDSGLSVQETTAALAAFAQAGIGGSDAGTSLKTMLSRLVPQTKKAREEMARLGLDFTDSTGTFLPITDVADQLHDKLGKLSDEERTTALATIFGSDARRAATVLMNEGAEGLQKYIKATSDQEAADKLAAAAMEGSSGALELLKGNIETAELALGKGLEPTTRAVADGLADMIGSGDFEKWGRGIGDGLKNVAEDYGPLAGQLKDLGKETLPLIGTTLGVVRDALAVAAPLASDLVGAFNDMPDWAKKAIIGGGLGAIAAKKLGILGPSGTQGAGAFLGGRGSTVANPLYVLAVGGTGLPTGSDGGVVATPTPGEKDPKTGKKPRKPTKGFKGAGTFVASALVTLFGEDFVEEGKAELLYPWSSQGRKPTLTAGSNTPLADLPISKYENELRRTQEGENPLTSWVDDLETEIHKLQIRKIQPTFDILGLIEAEAKVAAFAERARRPIRIPLIVDDQGLTHATTGGHEAPVPGESPTRGRTAPLIHIENMTPYDYRGMQRDLQQRAQQAALGAVGGF